MYKEFLNSSVCALVTTRSNGGYEVKGTLVEETEDTITIVDARIGNGVPEALKNNSLFNGPMQVYREQTSKVVINKEYIVLVIPA